MSRRVFIVGVGMTKFEKPFSKDWDYPDMVKESGTKALEDAGLGVEDIEQAAVGYCYGDSTYGQRSFYGLGMTGIAPGAVAVLRGREARPGGRRIGRDQQRRQADQRETNQAPGSPGDPTGSHGSSRLRPAPESRV